MTIKTGLICEGGGTKAAYTCGVLQCFLDNDIDFPYTVGISAGAEVLLPFVSKQRERLRISGVDAASDPKAIGVSPLLHERGVFGIDHVCKFIEEHAPLDYAAFMKTRHSWILVCIIWILTKLSTLAKNTSIRSNNV